MHVQVRQLVDDGWVGVWVCEWVEGWMDGGVEEWMGVRWNSTHVPCIAICEVWIGATTPLHITHNPTHTFLVNNADGWMREIVITDVWLYQAAHICFTSILVLELSNGGDPHTEGTAWQQRRQQQQQQQHCLPLHRLNVCVYGCVCMGVCACVCVCVGVS